ncbi:MAG: hypothetical protein WCL13_03290, partial [bacterium]
EFIPEMPALPGEEEFIPEMPALPGEEEFIPEMPALPGEEEFIPELPPLPGEEEFIPELPPLPGEEGYIPPLPDLNGEKNELTILDKINAIEEKIVSELNSLKSLCDKEEKKEIISASCIDACKKYSDCAGYTEDATKEDKKDAYDSCMIECAKWSDKTKICINKKPITAPIDCENLGFCALPEYGGGYSR